MGYIVSRQVIQIFYVNQWVLYGFFFRSYLSDSTVAMFCGILPLILPNSNPFKSIFQEKKKLFDI